MTLSLNVLKHLGLGLYSNVPAVLSEVVANAWDADAQKVVIDIDVSGKITITDDGHGMSVDDANKRYLYVGYERRSQRGESVTPKFERRVMGRKGIGKLSLFSIAKNIEIHSVKDGTSHGFTLNTDDIEKIIEKEESQYFPTVIPAGNVEIDKGTRIILTNMTKRLDRSSIFLRRRLARRFSIIGPDFQIILDGTEISPEDRAYHDKIQYIWTFDDRGKKVQDTVKDLDHYEERPSSLGDNENFNIGGWIGTARKSGDLRDSETGDSLNGIVILVRGKLAHENILQEFPEGGLYSKYVFGEIHADFLDQDDLDDIATTNRQKFVEDDPRYVALRSKLQQELKYIQSSWTDLRNKEGQQVAEMIPSIKKWINRLNPDHQASARKLFGRINQLLIDNDSDRRRIFIGNVLAFESLRFRHMTHRIEQISSDNLSALGEIFTQLDDLEESAYYQITRQRLEVINKLTNLVDENAKEKALQEHLFTHLWLLDPSWERAASTATMEKSIGTIFESVSRTLTQEQRSSRLDIQYTTTGKKHVVIELKRYNRSFYAEELVPQIRKYRDSIATALDKMGLGDEPLEFICVIGKPLRDWSSPRDGKRTTAHMLASVDARVVMYDELIVNAQQAYQDYLDGQTKAGRLYQLITEIEGDDFRALSPDAD